MELESLYRLIGLQDGMVQRLKPAGESVDLEKADTYLDGLMDIGTATEAYRELLTFLGDDPNGIKMLYCQLECARRAYGRFRELDIPESVYTDTMRCFTRFIGECARRTGRLAFDRGWWTYRQVSMTIFRLSTLEFELREFEGEKVISIHIPSDAVFTKKAVDKSLECADVFFRKYFGGGGRFMCNSWLLSPELTPMLPETSNILAFQRRFDLISEDREEKEFITWLFEVPEDTPYEDLPEGTSLQRSVKELLLGGGCVGSARGFLRTDDLSGGKYDHS